MPGSPLQKGTGPLAAKGTVPFCNGLLGVGRSQEARMSQDHPDPHLSQLSTLWSLVCRAHQGTEDARSAARQTLLDVHLLASTYGWTEPDILAVPPLRRRHYLELAGYA